jgi:hypothetical protein
MASLFWCSPPRLPGLCELNQIHFAGVLIIGNCLLERLLGVQEELEDMRFNSFSLLWASPSGLVHGGPKIG